MGFRYYGFPDFLFLLDATRWTILLSLFTFVAGGVLGTVVALARISASKPLRWLAIGFIQLVQGTPVLMQLFVWFFLLSLIGVNLPAFIASGIALTMYAAAFLGEIWRGCIQAIPKTQWEAAASIGMSRWEQVREIIAPQALRIAIPPTVGFMVQIVKTTSLTALVGFVEVTRAGQLVNSTTFQPLPVFCTVAAIYFAICFPLSFYSRRLEKKLNVGRQFAVSA
jgi:polar amino acid transport system permease protein